jgi:hypothetical protein
MENALIIMGIIVVSDFGKNDSAKTLTEYFQQLKENWDTLETLYIPGTRAYYMLVSLTFHHAKRVPTAEPYPDKAGHFTSWL